MSIIDRVACTSGAAQNLPTDASGYWCHGCLFRFCPCVALP